MSQSWFSPLQYTMLLSPSLFSFYIFHSWQQHRTSGRGKKGLFGILEYLVFRYWIVNLPLWNLGYTLLSTHPLNTQNHKKVTTLNLFTSWHIQGNGQHLNHLNFITTLPKPIPPHHISPIPSNSPSILYHQKIQIVFNFTKEILLRIFVFNFNKEIPLKFKNRSCLQFYKRNPFKNFSPSIYKRNPFKI